MKNTQYINIQGWMINELKLKGNDLIIYAIIYGFSQDEDSHFNGSLKYLIDATNTSRATVIRSMKSLTERGFVYKFDPQPGFATNIYVANPEVVSLCNQRGIKLTPEGGIKMIPNNTTSFINKNTQEIPLDFNKSKPVKKKFVPPTQSEVIEYFKLKGYSEEAAKKAFDYYEAGEWKDSQGNRVKNWKQKMIAVWFRPKNRNNSSSESFDRDKYAS